MSTHAPLTQHPAPMVPADHVALSIVEAFAIPKRSKEQKAAGLRVADVKAQGYAAAGVNPALGAAYGVNRAANLRQAQTMSLDGLIQGDQVRFAGAIRNVAAVAGIAFTFNVDVLASGEQKATRADWTRLRTELVNLCAAPDVKKAAQKRYTTALRMFDDIQAHAERARARIEARKQAEAAQLANMPSVETTE